MAADPKYVRLRTGLNGRYDLRSGWGISGLDVKEMPDKETRPKAYAYVKGELNAGRLEGASKAEYDEVQTPLVDAEDDEKRPYQEREVRNAARDLHSKIKARRSGDDESSAFDADERRRKDILKNQKAAAKKASKAVAEDDDDDDDDTDEYDAMNKNALVAKANERGLDSSGTAEDIRTRLRAADEDGEDDDDDESEDDEDDESTESEDDDANQS